MKKIALFLLLAGLCASSCSKFGYIGALDGTGYMNYPEDESDIQISGDRFDEFKENPFVSVTETPVSSFSVDADGAAYAYMRRSIINGVMVPAQSVRIEEYLNYFTFDYPEPANGETLGINAEAFACPWAPEHLLIRLGLKG
ncbi:MAG: von Willebrand factor type A domain-containing protein, partial [Bacteroidales bacterium]|nr:von Willebrand factor type A domain-containing protein [Bacteroidales bacterium]